MIAPAVFESAVESGRVLRQADGGGEANLRRLFQFQGAGQDGERLEVPAVGSLGVEGLERAQRQGHVLGQFRLSLRSRSWASRSVNSPSSLESLASLGSFWIRLASS